MGEAERAEKTEEAEGGIDGSCGFWMERDNRT
jgi:hypothetical protein